MSYYHDNKLQGLLVTHVDDIIYSGTSEKVKITEKFKISRLASGIQTRIRPYSCRPEVVC